MDATKLRSLEKTNAVQVMSSCHLFFYLMLHEWLKGVGFVSEFKGNLITKLHSLQNSQHSLSNNLIYIDLLYNLRWAMQYKPGDVNMSFISYLMSHECLKGAGFVAEFTGDFGFLSAVLSLICCNHVCQRNLFSCNLSCATSWIGLVRCRCTYLSPAKKVI